MSLEGDQPQLSPLNAGQLNLSGSEKMMTIPIPLSERVSASFAQLSSAAADLNAISDELGKSVAQIDQSLKKLNIGITVWITIRDEGDPRDPTAFSRDELGYAKTSGRWGISLRTLEGDDRWPDECDGESWLFSDAPRPLRIAAIDKIPDLLHEMSKKAAQTTRQIAARVEEVKSLASALNPHVTSPSGSSDNTGGGNSPVVAIKVPKGTLIARIKALEKAQRHYPEVAATAIKALEQKQKFDPGASAAVMKALEQAQRLDPEVMAAAMKAVEHAQKTDSGTAAAVMKGLEQAQRLDAGVTAAAMKLAEAAEGKPGRMGHREAVAEQRTGGK